MSKKIILGTAHLSVTPGKCSPDGRFRECNYSREIVTRLQSKLEEQGYKVFVDYLPLIPSKTWTGGWKAIQNKELSYRVTRVNSICSQYGSKNCVYVSIHNNAAGADGKWHNASGFTVFVSPNSSQNSKKLAKIFTSEALLNDLCGNRSIPKEKYWTSNLYVLRNTYCPAVLTENMFQDNKDDVDFLLSEEGKNAIVNLHYNSIIKYIKL